MDELERADLRSMIQARDSQIAFMRQEKIKLLTEWDKSIAEARALRADNADKDRELIARANILNRAVAHKEMLFPDELGNGWTDSIDKLAFEVETLREELTLANKKLDKLTGFADQIRRWLSKGNPEPIWYEDFIAFLDGDK